MLLKYFYGRWQCSTACSWSAASYGGRRRPKPEAYKNAKIRGEFPADLRVSEEELRKIENGLFSPLPYR